MYIFNRTRFPLPAHAVDANTLFVKLAARASVVTDRLVTAFAETFGDQPGALSLSCVVKNQAEQAKLSAAVAADREIQKLVASGANYWSANREDRLTRIVANGIDKTDATYYSSTTTVAADGRLLDAIALGVTLNDHVQKAGFSVAFGVSQYGPFGEIGWLLAADSAEVLDEFQAFSSTDEKIALLVNDMAALVLPGVSARRLIQRIS
jgi:hypothetical protein